MSECFSAFQDAHDLNIKNLSVSNVRTKIVNKKIIISQDIYDRAREHLDKIRAIEASHTSSVSSYIPKCLPGTRATVIEAIKDWVREAGKEAGEEAGETAGEKESPNSILWFSGPAGGGKTAIMKNVVEECGGGGEFLIASYFFSSSVPDLDHEQPFVATISHQLTKNAILERLILTTIYRRPSILQDSLDAQMEELIARPLESEVFRMSSPPKIVIAIDGFDECKEKKERRHLLRLLQHLVERLPQSILIILTCRPEFDIRSTFSKSLKPFTRSLQLQDYDGTEDTGAFMSEQFENICKDHLMKDEIPEDWPGTLMGPLLDKSSGFFAFPSILMKHVCDDGRNPVEALNEVLPLPMAPTSPIRVHPLEELNRFYSLILRPPETNLELMKRLLHTMLGVEKIHDCDYYHSPCFLDDLLFLPSGTTNITFRHLHSVLSPPQYKQSPIRFYHKSMQDYLLDPACRLDNGVLTMYQAPSETLADLADLTTRQLNGWEKNHLSSPHSIRFAALYWSDIIVQLMLQDHPTLSQVILEFDPRIILKYLFVAGTWRDSSHLNPARRSIHSTTCRRSRCSRLCMLLSRVEACWRAFLRPVGGVPTERQDRVNALPQICEETTCERLRTPVA